MECWASGRGVSSVSGGRVTVRARAARSGGGVQRSVTVRMMGRLRKSWSGSLWPGSRQATPTPLGRRERGVGDLGGGVEALAKGRTQLGGGRGEGLAGGDGKGVKGEAEGSMRVRR